MTKIFKSSIEDVLISGGIGIIPTDTIYAIAGSALNKRTVEKIYKLRKRNLKKPMIILIGSMAQLKIFGVRLDNQSKEIIKKLWPGKFSIVLPCRSKKWAYIHRGTKSLAFRLPQGKPHNRILINLLKKTGPLVAPSANFEGDPPAKNINEAEDYFGDKVDFYLDAGTLRSKPSTLIKIVKGKVFVLRMGSEL